MILGVTSFSFVTGSLSSIVSSYDAKETELSEQFAKLNRVHSVYNLPGSLTAQIKTALRFDSKKQNVSELDSILAALPLNLRL